MRSFVLLVIATAVLGCGGDSASNELPFTGPFPSMISETAAYLHAASHEWASEMQMYEPEYPLWSNGSTKQRAAASPDGVLPTDAFADGTLFFKTFSFNGEPVETRLLRYSPSRPPEYAVYLWNEQRTDATLVDGRDPLRVSVEVDGETFDHEIPSHGQCERCHEASPNPVLGYTAQQLSGELPGTVADSDRAVVGYALGNCVHCHNGSGLQGASFDLRPDMFVARTVNQPTQSSASAIGIRVIPGDPDASILFQGLSRAGRDVMPMPPAGVQRRDEAAVSLFRTWIDAL